MGAGWIGRAVAGIGDLPETIVKLADRKLSMKTGFDIGDEFVIGYGLDFQERYRNLPFIGTLRGEIYTRLLSAGATPPLA